ncbi:MAG: ABC transporter permease [Bryobacteraceae bacterium]|nr:ABC transporter permease [Bryobacteraceae bacterium]
MYLLRFAPLILKNALRNKRRSLLTILSISISICLLATMFSLYWSFFLRDPTADQALRLITIDRVSITNILPISYRERIRSVPGVREVMVMQWFGGVYKDSRDMRNMFARFSVEPRKLFSIFPEYRIPEDQKEAFIRDRRGCIIGKPLADRLNLKVGDRIFIKGDVFPMDLDLVLRGIYESDRDVEDLYFHHDYILEGYPVFKNYASMFIVLAEDQSRLAETAQAIDESFRNWPSETKTDTERNFEVGFLSYIGDVKMFILAVSLALAFTILLVNANTVAMTVRERTREIGVFRTLGYSEGGVLGLLLSESVTLSLIGGAAGLGLAVIVIAYLRTFPSMMVDLKPLTLKPAVVVACLGIAAMVGLASCFFPARHAARQPITEALRVVD